jgi:hypothetical protein
VDDLRWRTLSHVQEGVVALRQLRELGVPRGVVRSQLRAGRWEQRTHNVLTTTTGELTWLQRAWVSVLHAGPEAILGGLSAAKVHGLQGWEREEITVLVDNPLSFDPVPGTRFFRTRRSMEVLSSERRMPVCRVEPAALIFAGYEPHRRTAHGLVAAVVQQRLTAPEKLAPWIDTLRPLRRARELRALLGDLGSGAQSLAEVDVRHACEEFGVRRPQRQRRRRDSRGRVRWTDCEWELPGGRVLVLEIDGAFHMEFAHYTDDMRRQRRITSSRRMVVRCSSYEIRHEPAEVMEDLIELGVPRT